jgi:hypothetical protein
VILEGIICHLRAILKKLIDFASLAVYRDRAHKRRLTIGGLGFLVFWLLDFGIEFLLSGITIK